jgi:diguanylate cyclase (GGDEF)-like protein
LIRLPQRKSLRVKLVLASLVIEMLLLTVLVVNSMRLVEKNLVEQARLRVQELNLLLNASISGPLAERDFGTLQDILNNIQQQQGITYLVLYNERGTLVASSGWDKRLPVPTFETRDIGDEVAAKMDRFDTATPMVIAGQRLGILHYGVSTKFLREARSSLLQQSLAIAGLEVLLSLALLTVVGFWLTRHLVMLSRASEQVAAGNFDIQLPTKTEDEVGQLTQAFGVMSNAVRNQIAALRHSEEQQRHLTSQAQQEHARLNSLLSAMTVGVLFEDTQNHVVYVNPTFRRIWMIPEQAVLLGLPTAEALRNSNNKLAHPDHFSQHILDVLNTHQVSESFEISTADGRLLTQLSYPVQDALGESIGRLWIYEDVTHERQTAEQLIYLAERDSLTGLYNRHRFQTELGRTLADLGRDDICGALLFFDLDEFKVVNDTYGHRAGDAMLIRVAGEVSNLVRRKEILSRLGGDEFAVLMPQSSKEDALKLAERIIRGIAQIPFRFEGQNLRLTTSLGIALYPQHGTGAEELVSRADAAMYQAKEAGKNAWRVYQPNRDSSREMLNRLSWQERISNALENGLMRLHFQGVYRASNQVLTHLEVLVRMIDEANPAQLIMPARFIPLAERNGKIVEIDRWVIRESVRLLSQSSQVPPLAVNISGRSFDQADLPQYIAEQLQEFHVAPQRLLVELTETSAVTDLHDAQRFIEALQKTGCIVCLDDFGAGFSSFAYLKHLKVDVLKIDGLFVRDLPNDRDNQVFVKAIVDVARGMNKGTVAEFVESAETLAMLQQFGVDMVQGYYLDTPRADHPALTPKAPAHD